MAELKTKPHGGRKEVNAFIKTIDNKQVHNDCKKLLELMEKISRCSPVMWGDSIVGFDQYTYHYASGQSGDWLIIGFSPRKNNITIYLIDGVDNHKEQLKDFGPYTNAKSCLYIKKLDDVNTTVLSKILRASIKNTKKMWS